jgi:hypothetical protein
MNVSGTLHFYSGAKKELFFVFDDEVAKEMYANAEFDQGNKDSRRVYISIGEDRCIHRRTLSFSLKQTEIKVSLCARNSKNGLGNLTVLYDWFALGGESPAPFGVLGRLTKARHEGADVLELALTEPEGFIAPPGLGRRLKKKSPVRKSFEHRREIQLRDQSEPGRLAEELALSIARDDHPLPNYQCLWRQQFLDSEKTEIRKLGIIADIDIWDVLANSPKQFIEVKAQKVANRKTRPKFYLSVGEWRSYQDSQSNGIGYEIWLFQYYDLSDFQNAPHSVSLIVYDNISMDWLDPDGYLVSPTGAAGKRYELQI